MALDSEKENSSDCSSAPLRKPSLRKFDNLLWQAIDKRIIHHNNRTNITSKNIFTLI